MRTIIALLLLLTIASAATDMSVDDTLDFATGGIYLAIGSAALLGILVAIALAYMAWKRTISLPAVFVAATFVLALMAEYSFISAEWVYAALILGGILAGVGIGRWIGVI